MLYLELDKEVRMSNDLKGNRFMYSRDFCSKEFLNISEGIVICYHDIISNGISLVNNEILITKYIILNYLKNDDFKEVTTTLKNYHFDFETIENSGRVDIRVLPVNPYKGDKAYYIYECKRLDSKQNVGVSGLNAEYIKNGICRFVTDYYTSYYNENGMIGYVIEEMDILENVNCINNLLEVDYTNDRNLPVNPRVVNKLEQFNVIDGFPHLYCSRHKKLDEKEISLLHLMFDFSKNIA